MSLLQNSPLTGENNETSDQGSEDAFPYALEVLILWLEEDYGFPRIEAYLLLGQILEARCTAFVNPVFTYIAKTPKQFLSIA